MSVPYKTQNFDSIPNRVPYFIHHRAATRAKDQGDKYSNKKRTKKQFEEAVVSDLANIARVRRRTQILIKNTPKISIVNESADSITISVQCPKQSLIENLKTHNRINQLERILQAIVALFRLAENYGYFYCDKLMLKCSEDGSPIVWINQNFMVAERQFPIKECSVSELIFIKKIKNTIGDIVTFPKDIQIQTKNNLLSYIQSEKNKYLAAFNNFPQLPVKKVIPQPGQFKLPFSPKQRFSANYIGVRSVKSKSPFSGKFPFSPKSISRNLTSEKTAKNLPFKGTAKPIQFRNASKKSSQGKRNYQIIKRNRERTKTTAFDNNNYISSLGQQEEDKIFVKQNQQYSSKSQIIANQKKREQNLYQTPQQKSLPKQKELGFQSNQSHPSDTEQNEDTINEQFNFEQQLMEKPKDKVIDKKIRKQSADPNPFQSWLKSSNKLQEKTFQNSTFSTRVTFSSVKGEFESISDHGQSKEKKRESPKPDNHTIPHLYSTDKQRQSKQKFNAHIRKIMKESGLKIKEEDSFENQVQNLFQSTHPNKLNLQRQKILRESELMNQFEKLFVSSREQDKPIYIEDFLNVLE